MLVTGSAGHPDRADKKHIVGHIHSDKIKKVSFTDKDIVHI